MLLSPNIYSSFPPFPFVPWSLALLHSLFHLIYIPLILSQSLATLTLLFLFSYFLSFSSSILFYQGIHIYIFSFLPPFFLASFLPGHTLSFLHFKIFLLSFFSLALPRCLFPHLPTPFPSSVAFMTCSKHLVHATHPYLLHLSLCTPPPSPPSHFSLSVPRFILIHFFLHT